MKKTLTVLFLALSATFAFGHGKIEIGPNKGRILEFSANESMHGEVVLKDGKLHIALLDKEMKPVKLVSQTLSATAGTRADPVKLDVAKEDGGFVVPAPKGGEWLIFQYKENAGAKPVTARLHYVTALCGECQGPEWLCACGAKK